MSHRIKRFAAFAIFAFFYPFAALDSISGLFGHQVDTKLDTKTDQRNDMNESIRTNRILVSTCPLTGEEVAGDGLAKRPRMGSPRSTEPIRSRGELLRRARDQ